MQRAGCACTVSLHPARQTRNGTLTPPPTLRLGALLLPRGVAQPWPSDVVTPRAGNLNRTGTVPRTGASPVRGFRWVS